MHKLPMLAFFHYRDAKDLILFTDASDTAGSGVLMLELGNGARLPLSYCAYKFPESSLRQSIFRKEFYALAACLRKNIDILSVCRFKLFIDSKALFYAITSPKVKLTEQLYRLNAFVQSFHFVATWIPSKSNVSDILSRQVTADLPELDLSFLDQFPKDMSLRMA